MMESKMLLLMVIGLMLVILIAVVPDVARALIEVREALSVLGGDA